MEKEKKHGERENRKSNVKESKHREKTQNSENKLRIKK